MRQSLIATALAVLLAPPLQAASLEYDYDAANDTTGDNQWEDEQANAIVRVWAFDPNQPTDPVAVVSTLTTITSAYDFGGGTATDPNFATTGSYLGSAIDGGSRDATFEFWIRPGATGSQQVIFESGGNTNGISMVLNGTSVRFANKEGSTNPIPTYDLGGTPSDFIQVVGVVDSGSGQTRLYVNGVLRATGTTSPDWTLGTDGAGLGGINNALGGFAAGAPSSGYGNYDGQIARVRLYNGAMSDSEVGALYSGTANGTAGVDAYSSAVQGDGAVAYWRLADSGAIPKIFNQGSLGNTLDAADGATGTITYQASGLLPNLSNSAMHFDGSSIITVPTNSAINSGGPYVNKTVELWLKADAMPTDTSTHQVLYEQGGTTNGMNVYLYNGQLYAGVWGSTGTHKWVATPLVGSGTDHHVVLTYDGNTGDVIGYLDGKPFDAGTGALPDIPAHTGVIGIGARNVDTRYADSASGSATFDADHFAGVIDELALYNSTLTGSQVASHFTTAGGIASALTIRGLKLNYDANLESADTPWANRTSLSSRQGTANAFDWNPTNATLESVVSSRPGIAQAYEFSGSGASLVGSGANDSYDELLPNTLGDATLRAATFELWFKPNDLTGKEVLFETGGTTIGSSVRLNGDLLELATIQNANSGILSFDLDMDGNGIDYDDFIQVVGVLDPTNMMQLYINGGLVAAGAMPGNDWSGAGDTRFAVAGDLGGGQGSGFGAFSGQIAIFRYYDGVLDHHEVGANYFAVSNIVPEPSTWAMLLGLGVLGLLGYLRRRRRS